MNTEDTTPLGQYLKLSAKFLRYLFKDIDYKYEDLTDHEKSLCSEKEFKAFVAQVKSF